MLPKVLRVERNVLEEVGPVLASAHPESWEAEAVRAVYLQEMEASGEDDLCRLEVSAR